MKLSGTINRLTGVEKNIDNAISFLQVQDGVLESAGKILDRMAELKALSLDVLKIHLISLTIMQNLKTCRCNSIK